MVAEVWIQSIAVIKGVDIKVLLTWVAFMGEDWGCLVADTGGPCQLQNRLTATHRLAQQPCIWHISEGKKKKGNKKHSVERRIGRKSEKSRRCQDQEDEEVRRRSSRAGNMYVQTAGVFPEGTTSHEGSTLQKICFPRGLSPMEALELEKTYEEGMAKMKFWTNCKCNIPHPALPVASRQ